MTEHEVCELAAFKLVGLGTDLPLTGPVDLGLIWGDFFCRMQEIKPIGRMLGVSLLQEGQRHYSAMAEVAADADVPPGMAVLDLPTARWLRLHFSGRMAELPGVIAQTFSEVLPANRLTAAVPALCFEEYKPDWLDEKPGIMNCDLYVQLAD